MRFSWLRRLLKTFAFWPKILEIEISKVLGYKIEATKVLCLGPAKLEYIGKRVHNLLWRDVLISVKTVMQGSLLSAPEKIVLSPLWDNPVITKNGKTLKPANYPVPADKICQVSDFFQLGTNEFCSESLK